MAFNWLPVGKTGGRHSQSGGLATADYDAFISYSHQDDGDLAAALQSRMQRFAKPWYRMRALRVFRDTASLSANLGLWASIEKDLAASRWLVLLASPGAARSEWVNREVGWWLAHRPQERLLIVATSPGLVWDNGRRDWAKNAPVPPALRGVLTAQPLWADLASLPRESRQRPPDEVVAAVAAPIRGKPKDELIGEHLHEHRRYRRLARSAASALVVLTVAAVTAAFLAVGQRDNALTQARIATSGELAALVSANLTSNLDLAQLLAVAAYQTDDSPQAWAALVQAATASPHLQRYLQVGAPVSALATSANGTVIVVGTASGQLVRFDLVTGARAAAKAAPSPISQLAVSADGTTVVATDGTQAVEWEPGTGHQPQPITPGVKVTAVAVSPSGQMAATLEASTTSAGILVVRNFRTGRQAHAVIPGSFNKLTFVGNSSLMLLNGTGGWEQMSVTGLHRLGGNDKFLLTATGDDVTGSSPDSAYFGYAEYGSVVAWRSDESKWKLSANDLGPVASASSLAISPDGKWAALAVAGAIYVGPLRPYSPPPDNNGATGIALAANDSTSAVSFLGGDDRLVSVAGSALALWNLKQASRIGEPAGVPVPVEPLAGGPVPPAISVSPDGHELIMPDGSMGGYGLFAYRADGQLVKKSNAQDGGLVAWLASQPVFVGLGTGNTIDVTNAQGKQVKSFPARGATSPPVAGQYLPQSGQLIVIDQSGVIWLLDMRTNSVRTIHSRNAFVQPQDIAISALGWTAEYNQQNGKVFLVNLRTGDTHVVGSGNAEGILFTRDRLLIQRSTGSLEVWDITGRHLLATLPGAGGYAGALAVSSDGSLVARLSDNGTASVASLGTGDVLANLSLPVPANAGYSSDPWRATTMIFAPDGHSLLTATAGDQVIRWDIDPSGLIAIACATAGRGLTTAEWRDYIRTTPPSNLSCQRLCRYECAACRHVKLRLGSATTVAALLRGHLPDLHQEPHDHELIQPYCAVTQHYCR